RLPRSLSCISSDEEERQRNHHPNGRRNIKINLSLPPRNKRNPKLMKQKQAWRKNLTFFRLLMTRKTRKRNHNPKSTSAKNTKIKAPVLQRNKRNQKIRQ